MQKEIAYLFAIEGKLKSISPLGNGLIHHTYKVRTNRETYVVQQINQNVFPNVEHLMQNILEVTTHLKEKGIPTLEIVKAKTGDLFIQKGDLAYRCYRFIEHAICFDALPNLEMIEQAGCGFGQFHQTLSDCNIDSLVPPIPGFHDTYQRYGAFLVAANEDTCHRLESCEEEARFLIERKNDYAVITDLLNEKKIHSAIIHNDPKVNNVAFDENDNRLICILDLDTVMAGSYLYDFGDALRAMFTGKNEDSENLDLLKVDLSVYEAFLRGYIKMMGQTLNQTEKDLLPFAPLLLAEELAMRFLGDYLCGDTYFKTDSANQNLRRARAQIALAKDIIANFDALKVITETILNA